MVLALVWHSGNKFKDDLLGWRELSLAFTGFNGIPFRFEPLRTLPFIIPSYMPEEIQHVTAVTQNPYFVPDWCWLGGYINNISTPASETSDTFVHGGWVGKGYDSTGPAPKEKAFQERGNKNLTQQ